MRPPALRPGRPGLNRPILGTAHPQVRIPSFRLAPRFAGPLLPGSKPKGPFKPTIPKGPIIAGKPFNPGKLKPGNIRSVIVLRSPGVVAPVGERPGEAAPVYDPQPTEAPAAPDQPLADPAQPTAPDVAANPPTQAPGNEPPAQQPPQEVQAPPAPAEPPAPTPVDQPAPVDQPNPVPVEQPAVIVQPAEIPVDQPSPPLVVVQPAPVVVAPAAPVVQSGMAPVVQPAPTLVAPARRFAAPVAIPAVQPLRTRVAVAPVNAPATLRPNPAPAATGGSFVSVTFQPNISTQDVTTFLTAYNVAIVEGPNADGLYRIQLSDGELPADQVTQVVDSMRSQTTIIATVAPEPTAIAR